MAPEPGWEDAEEGYRFFAEARSGIPFDLLTDFASPLLDLYGLPAARLGDSPDALAPEQLPSAVTALSAAELFWSYFSLEPERRRRFRDALRVHFIGPEPQPHELAEFALLMEMLEQRWTHLNPTVRLLTGNALDKLGDLLGDPGDASGAEMMAAFGEPLMSDPSVFEDPDRLEQIMLRVEAYWSLAQCGPDQFDTELARVVNRFADTQEDREAIRTEALRMVRRYKKKFGHGLAPGEQP